MEVSRTLFRMRPLLLALLVVLLPAARAYGQIGATVPNWTVPSSSFSTSSTTPGHARALGDVTNPTPFIGVTPCRIVDTRGANGPYGGPALVAGTPRDFALLGGPCAGLPAGVSAYSLNFTVVNAQGPGDIRVYPQGGATPLVSTLNYVGGQTVANAAIVPAGTGGGITVQADVHGTNLIIDINGYFPGSGINGAEQFSLSGHVPGGCVVCGENLALGAYSSGVSGIETTGFIATQGVLGLSDSTAFIGHFGWSPAGVTGIGSSSGVLGVSMDRGVVGVLLDSSGNDLAEGWAGKSGSSAAIFGLEGILVSSPAGQDSAGVKGIASDGQPPKNFFLLQAGVRGESVTEYGVVGISQFTGTFGVLVNSSGTMTATGELGTSIFGGPWGVYAEGNIGASGTKPFVEVHPTDANKLIRYVALEGPEAGTYFRGTAETHNGLAVIPVPETFRLVTDTDGLTVQLTPVGAPATMYVVSQDLNQIVVHSSLDVKFHYMVNGVRATFKDWQVVVDGGYMPESATQRLPDYFSPEQKRRLIANGTYNADGTVNMETARRLGWDRMWQAREAVTRAGATANAALSSDRSNK